VADLLIVVFPVVQLDVGLQAVLEKAILRAQRVRRDGLRLVDVVVAREEKAAGSNRNSGTFQVQRGQVGIGRVVEPGARAQMLLRHRFALRFFLLAPIRRTPQ
jgi:hypothetical protein